MKIFHWVKENILFVFTLFLLAFIPLYPKLPLLDVAHTWVYVRAEDFVVVLVLIFWIVLLFGKKVTLRTPLTIPIFLFWIIGAIATIHAMLFVFPQLANVFPNVAFLSLLRRIEYLSVFFVAYAAMKDKRSLAYVIGVLSLTLLLVVGYGAGQKYFGLPAYLTMNEEFAKGVPIQLSSLSRVPSTFAGHYDLAAYLVLVIPILASMVFGFRNLFVRFLLLITVVLGFGLLFMTVSRVSFFVLLISFLLLLLLHRKKVLLFSLPFVILIAAFVVLSTSPKLADRFGSTVKEVNVLVDADTGNEIGHIKEAQSDYFRNKIIEKRAFRKNDDLKIGENDLRAATSSAILPFMFVPPKPILLVQVNAPTGENLPQGTGYINLPLSPVVDKTGEFFYEQTDKNNTLRTFVFYGDFIVKKAAAYDLSFTTRFQGEWPHAIDAFKRNIFLGSGYSSVSLAVDNNYLRLLGETGLLGFISFIAIFVVLAIYIKKLLPRVDSPVVTSFVFGFIAGLVGLALNAIFIDVFEASKVAFTLWFLTGVTVGILHTYQKEQINIYRELKNMVTSKYAIIGYVFILLMFIFSPMISNFYVGDDFTWLRWVSECQDKSSLAKNCTMTLGKILGYFTQSDGFFYRPGTKIYFSIMHSLFWFNQTAYHIVSLLLHFISATLLFLIAKKILRDIRLAGLATFSFFIFSGPSEAVFWIAATGHLFNAVFILLSLFFFILWDEKNKIFYYVGSVLSLTLSLLFHELGIVTPFLIMLYQLTMKNSISIHRVMTRQNFILFIPIVFYLGIRYVANSHWFSGDYNYDLIMLPFNVIGNIIGYLMITLFGPTTISFYENLRNFSKDHIALIVVICLVAIVTLVGILRLVVKMTKVRINEEWKAIFFSFFFFVIALLPFLGLGNITSRYSYLSSVGLMLFLSLLVKKLYDYLLSNGRDIAFTVITVVISVFYLLHIMQIQQLHSDWYEAGKKVNKFFVSIDKLYADSWLSESFEFHFVNVPIRVGEAWVFPVGLEDALWLVFKNPSIKVYKWNSLREAFAAVDGSWNKKVFVFDDSGNVIEKRKPVSAQ